MSERDKEDKRELARRRIEHVFGGPTPVHVVRNVGAAMVSTANPDSLDCATRVEIGDALLQWAEDAT